MKYRSMPVAVVAALIAATTTVQAQNNADIGGYGLNHGGTGIGGSSPVFTWTGSLPAGSFGDTDIPTDMVVRSITGGDTLGLAITRRYTSPVPTYNGAGTFTALAGESTGAPDPVDNAGYSTWSLNYYVGGDTTRSFFLLSMDPNPAVGDSLVNDSRRVSAVLGYDGSLPYFGSFNLGIANWQRELGGFDPYTPGEYTFWLHQVDANNVVLQNISINVDVVAPTTTTPEPSSLALLGTGLIGLAGFVKRHVNR